MAEKNAPLIPQTTAELAAPAPRRQNWKLVALPLLTLSLIVFYLGTSGCPHFGKGHDGANQKVQHHGHHGHHHHKGGVKGLDLCPAQPAPLNVGDSWDPNADTDYALAAADRLSRAVQIETVSFDNIPMNASDPYFDKHTKFANFLESEFPTVEATLQHEIVNQHAHLYTWKGSNEDLKPVYLMAHTDTVPVNPDTVSQWTFPPWSGHISTDAPGVPGTWIWGRGSSDCKNSAIGILNAAEKLAQEGWKPERTILIGYGFDEEIGGPRGAQPLADLIEERYGAGGVAFVVDEGFSGLEKDVYGAQIASIGMAEKGAVGVRLVVDTLGGHSSVPPVHTGIGYSSKFIAALEDNPYKPALNEDEPYLKYLSCLAKYAPKFPAKLAKRVNNPKSWPKLAKKLAASDRIINSYLATTTATDIINGGVKVNALPESVVTEINHRISFTSSVNATLEHYRDVLVPLAKAEGFSVTLFGEGDKRTSKHLSIEISGDRKPYGLEPAPITPAGAPFALMAGTIKTVFGEETVVAPTGMFANTDTARVWPLTKHIFRFTPAYLTETHDVHTVDERMSLEGHLTTTQFYYKLLRNTEGWTD